MKISMPFQHAAVQQQQVVLAAPDVILEKLKII